VVLALANSTVYIAAALGATLGGALLAVWPVTSLPVVGLMLYATALGGRIQVPGRTPTPGGQL
jgi:predicted MFS family arabinose efflux permease